MSLPDTMFIFALALVIFGPKKLPEIGRQLGKLVLEFRRASNEFKMQIEEELRNAEEQERQKQLAAQAASPPAATVTSSQMPLSPTIRPPSTGTQVSAENPSTAVAVGTLASESIPAEPETASLDQQTPETTSQVGLEEQTTHHHG